MDDIDNEAPTGYCSPPRHSQFRPGQSGNPGGRPRGSKNRHAVLAAIMQQPASYAEGGVKYSGTKLDLLVRTISILMAKGNEKARDLHERLSGYLDEAGEYQPMGVLIVQGKMSVEDWITKYGGEPDG